MLGVVVLTAAVAPSFARCNLQDEQGALSSLIYSWGQSRGRGGIVKVRDIINKLILSRKNEN